MDSMLKGVMLGAVVSLSSHTVLAVPSQNNFSAITVCDVKLETICADGVGYSDENTDPDGAAIVEALFSGAPFGLLFKAEADGSGTGSYMGIDFALSGFPKDDTYGDFTFSWLADPADLLPKAIDLVFAVKAASGFAAYWFDDVVLTDQGGGAGSSEGLWKITFLSNGGQIPGLSHLSLFIRDGVCHDDDPDCVPVDDDPPPPGVPVPGTLFLLGLGLLGMRLARKA